MNTRDRHEYKRAVVPELYFEGVYNFLGTHPPITYILTWDLSPQMGYNGMVGLQYN